MDLLNHWQRDFPLVDAPFAAIGVVHGLAEAEVLQHYRHALADQRLSRIGGVWGAGAGGAALLCAYAVAPERLAAVAAIVDAEPGVNHNYEREHRFNLWFVVTGGERDAVRRAVDRLDAAAGLVALRLVMQRAYRIDLGFDLRSDIAAPRATLDACAVPPVQVQDRPLAALLEQGLPLVPRPYQAWAEVLDRSGDEVRATLARWMNEGTLRRFGAIVRHHEFGFAHNAMTVFDVADDAVDAHAALLARQRGVTLCYRRERASAWRYNLYCMVHGRDRASVRECIAAATQASGLAAVSQAVLFSKQRFKQIGARYFAAPVAVAA